MPKLKNCAVKLVSENKKDVLKWLKQIKKEFGEIHNTDIKKCCFDSENITDYRTTVYFDSTETKEQIYLRMNKIKANPIHFF